MRAHNQAKYGGKNMANMVDSSLTDTELDYTQNHQKGTHGRGNHGEEIDFTSQSISLSDSEVESLLYMIEEEKMAHDIYVELYEQTGLIEFDKISESEQHHYDKLVSFAEKLDIDISSLSVEAGVFENDEIQTLYDTLMLEASLSTEAAIGVAISIEEADIADLGATIEMTETVILGQVYSHLLDSSMNHLSAFEGIA